jgi:inner membrane protein
VTHVTEDARRLAGMQGTSHFLIGGAVYAALALQPLPTPLGGLHIPQVIATGQPGTISGAAAGGADDPLRVLAVSVVIAAVAALAPDIDKASSMIARSLGPVTRAPSWLAEHTLGHRGPLHSLVAAVVVYALGRAAEGPLGATGLGAVLAFGWTTHLIADGITRGGIPLLWPLWRRRIRLPLRIASGGTLEALVVALVLLVSAWWIVAPEFTPERTGRGNEDTPRAVRVVE